MAHLPQREDTRRMYLNLGMPIWGPRIWEVDLGTWIWAEAKKGGNPEEAAMEKLSKNYTSSFAFTIPIQFNRLALVPITILASPPIQKTVFTLTASICSNGCTEFRFPGVTVLRVCWNQQSVGSWSVSLWPVLSYLSFPSLRRQTGRKGSGHS